MFTTLSKLTLHHKAIVESFSDLPLSLKLLEMGCTPGEIVTMVRVAPGGDPIAIEVAGYTLSMRLDEAKTIRVKLID